MSTASLDKFAQILRPDQIAIERDALALVAARDTLPPGIARRRLYSAPCGAGKGSIALALLRALGARGLRAICVTPSLEVIRGFLQRTGVDQPTIDGCNADELAAAAELVGVYTYGRLYRRVLKNSAARVDVVIIDEAHHWSMSGRMARTLTAAHPMAIMLGFSASPFRGTPKATQELIKVWGEPVYSVDYADAARLGLVQIPYFHVAPLVDDDLISISAAGEFIAAEVERVSSSRIHALVKLCIDLRASFPALPAMVTLPSTGLLQMFREVAALAGLPVLGVTQETPARERSAAFEACRERRALLAAIGVVGEGVDLPWLKLIIDARPTMSPVIWLQLIGRAMRPGGARPVYVATNRNVERHSYLLAGCIPPQQIQECLSKFEQPATNGGARVIGLEDLGKIKSFNMPVRGGGHAQCYALTSVDKETGLREDYSIVHVAWLPKPIVMRRTLSTDPQTGLVNYAAGRWIPADMPSPDKLLTARTIKKKKALSDKQIAFWNRCAPRIGLDVSAIHKVDLRVFDAFAALCQTGLRIL